MEKPKPIGPDMLCQSSEILNIAQVHEGQRVHYHPDHYGDARWENGIVKEVREGVTDAVWVVYNCSGNWDRYRDYTSAKTRLEDLRIGWKIFLDDKT